MKIGFPNHPRRDLCKEIEWIGENGFDFVDIFLEEDRAVPHKIDVEAARTLMKQYRLDAVGHLAWYLPVGSPVKSLRDAALSEAVKCFDVFSRLRASYVTVHTNWPSGLFSAREGIRFQVSTLKRITAAATEYGLGVMLEPIDTPKDSVEHIAEILRRVPGLHLHIDTGHANLNGRSPGEFIRKFRTKLRHIHLNDNDGRRDLHLPVGAGAIDWEKIIPVLKRNYDGTITLEIFSRDRDYVLFSKDKLKKLWKRS